MDPKLYKAVMLGDGDSLNELTKLDPGILLNTTLSQEDTVLHVAAKFKQKKMAEEILKLQPSLVYQKNSKGDTPLHIAARLGSEETVEFFMQFSNKTSIEEEVKGDQNIAEEKLTRMVNLKKETALHEAVKNDRYEVVKMLIDEDPEQTGFTNVAGESPLFLAVDRNLVKIAKLILETDKCSFGGRNNMNALHAAIVRSKSEVGKFFPYMKMLIMEHPPKKLANLKVYADINCFKNMIFNVPFILMHLVLPIPINTAFIKAMLEKNPSAILEVDKKGWTPLHFAAYLGKSNIVNLFLTLESDHKEYQISSPDSIASIRDKQGKTILHVASEEGRVTILRILKKLCPDIWDMQDNKGRTALHLAVQNEKYKAVKYILEQKLTYSLVNEQDYEGNTPMHIAAIQGYQSIFELFKKDKRVDKAISNNKGLGVLDMIRLNEDLTLNEKCWMGFSAARKGSLASLESTVERDDQDIHVCKIEKPKHPQKIEEIEEEEEEEETVTDFMEKVGSLVL